MEDELDIVTTGGKLMRTNGAEGVAGISGAKLMMTSRLAELVFAFGGRLMRTYGAGAEELEDGI